MIVPVLVWKDLPPDRKERMMRRSEEDISRFFPSVQTVLDAVRDRGDEAVRDFSHKWDNIDPTLPLRLSEKEIANAGTLLEPRIRDALDYVIENVRRFHEIQLPQGMSFLEVRPGILAGERYLPLDAVGLYVPRGKGSFPSMVYMLAVPASLARVKRIAMVTPPLADGSIDPACLYAAWKCGVTDVYRVGGAQAVAALAYGTESVKRVEKIVGPGSAWVTAAKRLLSGVIDTGLPAGPSESVILADETAQPRLLALDLLVEAEHGSDSSGFLAITSRQQAEEVQGHAEEMIQSAPEPRKTYLKESFEKYGAILLFDAMNEAAEWVNAFAPEHLSLQVAEPFVLMGAIKHAGEILLGSNLPFSAANYATGPNAVLPTGGKAKTWGPVSVRDFMKATSIVSLSRGGLEDLAPHVVALADYEGFPLHADAVRRRFAP